MRKVTSWGLPKVLHARGSVRPTRQPSTRCPKHSASVVCVLGYRLTGHSDNLRPSEGASCANLNLSLQLRTSSDQRRWISSNKFGVLEFPRKESPQVYRASVWVSQLSQPIYSPRNPQVDRKTIRALFSLFLHAGFLSLKGARSRPWMPVKTLPTRSPQALNWLSPGVSLL